MTQLAVRTYCSNNWQINEIFLFNLQDLINVFYSHKYTSF